MSRSSTLRRARGGSIKKQEPVSKKNLLWMIEKARNEYMRREARLQQAAAVCAHYWAILAEKYPDEAKALLEYEAEMMKAEQERIQDAQTQATEVQTPTT